MSLADWIQVVSSFGVLCLALSSGILMHQHWKAIRQLNATLELVDQGIKILVAASGVHLIRAQGERDGEIEMESADGLRAKVHVAEIKVTKPKLH